MSAFASLDLATLRTMRAETLAALQDLMTKPTTMTSRFGDGSTWAQRRGDLKAHLDDLEAAIRAKEGTESARGPIYLVGTP